MKQETKYKDTAVGKIPEDWEVKHFDEIFTFLRTNSFSRDNLTYDEINNEIFNIHYGDIHATFKEPILDFNKENNIPKVKDEFIEKIKISEDDYLKDGDLIIADASEDYEGLCDSVEIINLENRKAVSGLHTFAVRANKDNIAKGFNAYILRSQQLKKEFRRIATGISVFGVSKTNLSKVKLPIPPLPEQKAIAKVLSTWDKAIEKHEQLIAQKELRKKGLMQRLLNEKFKEKNEKWEEKSEKLKEKREKYRKVHLGEIAKITMGQSPNSEDYNTEANGFPLIQGNADIQDRKQIIRFWTDKSNKECDAGDIILTVRAPVGAIGIATHYSSIGRGVCSIRPKSVDYWYLYHLLVFNENNWKNLEQGSTFTAVNSKDIFNFSLFIIHSIEEQNRIAQILQAADKEIQLLKEKTERLREQKKGLMQVLLTGKKRLNYNLVD